jgi:hypothetical protein
MAAFFHSSQEFKSIQFSESQNTTTTTTMKEQTKRNENQSSTINFWQWRKDNNNCYNNKKLNKT